MFLCEGILSVFLSSIVFEVYYPLNENKIEQVFCELSYQILKNLPKFLKIFKVCLDIFQHYALKGR